MIKRRQYYKVRTYRQYGQCCFYTGLNTRKNYLLITAKVLRLQSKDIRDSTLTIDSPSKAGVSKLQRYKHKNSSNHPPVNPYSTSTRRSSQQVTTTATSQYIYVYTYSNLQRATGFEELLSSPRFNDNSSQVSIDFTLLEDRVKAFFLQLKSKSFQIYRKADVNNIKQKFLDRDYSLKSILKCSYTIQKEIGFKEGQQLKQRPVAKRYKELYIQSSLILDGDIGRYVYILRPYCITLRTVRCTSSYIQQSLRRIYLLRAPIYVLALTKGFQPQ